MCTRTRPRGGRPWTSVRTRLTVFYGVLFVISGIGLLAINYVLVDHSTSTETVTLVFPDGGSATATVDLAAADESNPLTHTSSDAADRPIQNGPDPAKMRDLALEQHASHMRTLLTQSGIALLAVTGLSVVLGWVMADRALRPLRTITAATRQITAHNLDERLALHGPRDEVRELADTIDELLARLDHAFQAQRRFVANASHELRTPLARARTIAQVALDDPTASADALRAAHERVLAAGAQQEELIDTLLTLARSQSGIVSASQVQLAELARDAAAAAAEDIRRAQVRLDCALGNATFRGDRKLAERLLHNLLDNAIRYNHPAGRVRMATLARAGQPVLLVANTGPVIPPEEVDHLFEPFRRLDSGRTHNGDGHGLGLSIVRAVADAHQAIISAVAQPGGGLAVEVRFPATSVCATPDPSA